ncbi:5-carboxymethyl-2-hydroxymuconate isomerase [Sagittula sp. NFXS13]|uniref:5-carboxymethyl-2-hydroxymuconate isomerase n=1 Tax=Sagittula sp. NFXS13 TaxID=2819095 RepID=UPI0032DFC787
MALQLLSNSETAFAFPTGTALLLTKTLLINMFIIGGRIMPHMTVEFSDGLSTESLRLLCRTIYEVLAASDDFPTAGIRVRVHKADIAFVGDGLPENDFVALTLSVGAGRTRDVLHAAGSQIFAAAQEALADRLAEPYFSLSLEIRQIDPDLSWKDTPIHARFSPKKD